MIIRIVKMTFVPQKVVEFEQLFDQVKMNIVSFEGCVQLDLCRSVHLPNVFFTYSIWENEESLENYRKSGLFAETWKLTKSMFASPAEAWSIVKLVSLNNHENP